MNVIENFMLYTKKIKKKICKFYNILSSKIYKKH